MLGGMEGYGIHPSTGLPIMSSSHDISTSGEDSSTSLKREIEDVFGNNFNSPYHHFDKSYKYVPKMARPPIES